MKVPLDGLIFDVGLAGPAHGAFILLLHGFPQHAGMWDRVAPLLHLEGYQTIALDQRGYSPGARPEPVEAYAMANCVADALGVIDAVAGGGPVHVIGHDWGAMVAWHLASRYPQRIRTLTAVSVPHPLAFGNAIARDSDQQRRSAYIQLFRVKGKAEEVLLRNDAAALRAAFDGCPPERIDDYVRPMRQPGALTGALNWYRAMSRRDNEGLQVTDVPTTFVWGDQDVAVGARAARDCAQYVSADYRFVPLTGISHWIPDQVPEALVEAIVRRVSG